VQKDHADMTVSNFEKEGNDNKDKLKALVDALKKKHEGTESFSESSDDENCSE